MRIIRKTEPEIKFKQRVVKYLKQELKSNLGSASDIVLSKEFQEVVEQIAQDYCRGENSLLNGLRGTELKLTSEAFRAISPAGADNQTDRAFKLNPDLVDPHLKNLARMLARDIANSINTPDEITAKGAPIGKIVESDKRGKVKSLKDLKIIREIKHKRVNYIHDYNNPEFQEFLSSNSIDDKSARDNLRKQYYIAFLESKLFNNPANGTGPGKPVLPDAKNAYDASIFYLGLAQQIIHKKAKNSINALDSGQGRSKGNDEAIQALANLIRFFANTYLTEHERSQLEGIEASTPHVVQDKLKRLTDAIEKKANGPTYKGLHRAERYRQLLTDAGNPNSPFYLRLNTTITLPNTAINAPRTSYETNKLLAHQSDITKEGIQVAVGALTYQLTELVNGHIPGSLESAENYNKEVEFFSNAVENIAKHSQLPKSDIATIPLDVNTLLNIDIIDHLNQQDPSSYPLFDAIIAEGLANTPRINLDRNSNTVAYARENYDLNVPADKKTLAIAMLQTTHDRANLPPQQVAERICRARLNTLTNSQWQTINAIAAYANESISGDQVPGRTIHYNGTNYNLGDDLQRYQFATACWARNAAARNDIIIAINDNPYNYQLKLLQQVLSDPQANLSTLSPVHQAWVESFKSLLLAGQLSDFDISRASATNSDLFTHNGRQYDVSNPSELCALMAKATGAVAENPDRDINQSLYEKLQPKVVEHFYRNLAQSTQEYPLWEKHIVDLIFKKVNDSANNPEATAPISINGKIFVHDSESDRRDLMKLVLNNPNTLSHLGIHLDGVNGLYGANNTGMYFANGKNIFQVLVDHQNQLLPNLSAADAARMKSSVTQMQQVALIAQDVNKQIAYKKPSEFEVIPGSAPNNPVYRIKNDLEDPLQFHKTKRFESAKRFLQGLGSTAEGKARINRFNLLGAQGQPPASFLDPESTNSRSLAFMLVAAVERAGIPASAPEHLVNQFYGDFLTGIEKAQRKLLENVVQKIDPNINVSGKSIVELQTIAREKLDPTTQAKLQEEFLTITGINRNPLSTGQYPNFQSAFDYTVSDFFHNEGKQLITNVKQSIHTHLQNYQKMTNGAQSGLYTTPGTGTKRPWSLDKTSLSGQNNGRWFDMRGTLIDGNGIFPSRTDLSVRQIEVLSKSGSKKMGDGDFYLQVMDAIEAAPGDSGEKKYVIAFVPPEVDATLITNVVDGKRVITGIRLGKNPTQSLERLNAVYIGTEDLNHPGHKSPSLAAMLAGHKPGPDGIYNFTLIRHGITHPESVLEVDNGALGELRKSTPPLDTALKALEGNLGAASGNAHAPKAFDVPKDQRAAFKEQLTTVLYSAAFDYWAKQTDIEALSGHTNMNTQAARYIIQTGIGTEKAMMDLILKYGIETPAINAYRQLQQYEEQFGSFMTAAEEHYRSYDALHHNNIADPRNGTALAGNNGVTFTGLLNRATQTKQALLAAIAAQHFDSANFEQRKAAFRTIIQDINNMNQQAQETNGLTIPQKNQINDACTALQKQLTQQLDQFDKLGRKRLELEQQCRELNRLAGDVNRVQGNPLQNVPSMDMYANHNGWKDYYYKHSRTNIADARSQLARHIIEDTFQRDATLLNVATEMSEVARKERCKDKAADPTRLAPTYQEAAKPFTKLADIKYQNDQASISNQFAEIPKLRSIVEPQIAGDANTASTMLYNKLTNLYTPNQAGDQSIQVNDKTFIMKQIVAHYLGSCYNHALLCSENPGKPLPEEERLQLFRDSVKTVMTYQRICWIEHRGSYQDIDDFCDSITEDWIRPRPQPARVRQNQQQPQQASDLLAVELDSAANSCTKIAGQQHQRGQQALDREQALGGGLSEAAKAEARAAVSGLRQLPSGEGPTAPTTTQQHLPGTGGRPGPAGGRQVQ